MATRARQLLRHPGRSHPHPIVRDGDAIRGFVNVCRHRAHLVAQGRGRRRTLQCPYHAWTYGLDGCLRSAPRSQSEAAFPFEQLSLRAVACETAGPFVFVNPDLDAMPLALTLGPVLDRVGAAGIDFDRMRMRHHQDWHAHGNWKTSVENYLECYHCPVAHPSFSRAIDVSPDAYRLEIEGQVASQYGPARHGSDELPPGEISEAQYHLIFPNTSVDVAPGPPNVQIYAWIPDGPAGMLGIGHAFYGDDTTDAEIEQITRFNKRVNDEDVSLVNAVQLGLDSGAIPHGRLMGEAEKLIARFQRLVYDSLRGEL
jgi:phenylpropionate dioxygenase-like ring-hydroxylating dioxygenase large terminal subunit